MIMTHSGANQSKKLVYHHQRTRATAHKKVTPTSHSEPDGW
ncbi:hypothetical protein DsansV1_C02g0017971 [Dioscorea sansibarensis]